MLSSRSRLRRALLGAAAVTTAMALTVACSSEDEPEPTPAEAAPTVAATAATAEPTPAAPTEPNAVGVTATDFAFALDGTFAAGSNLITLTNNGQQTHHGQLIALSEGKTADDLAALIAAGEETLPEWAVYAGGPGAVDPGQSTTLAAELEAGAYVLLCFIPDIADGVPHVAKGMVASFDVAAEPVNAVALPAATVEVAGGDYLFEAPETVPAGEAVVAFSNDGEEAHEMAVVRLNDGATVEDYLGAITAETPTGPPPGVFVGGVQGIVPGASQSWVVDLEAGSYGLLCFFANAEGVPHFALGMVGQLTVE